VVEGLVGLVAGNSDKTKGEASKSSQSRTVDRTVGLRAYAVKSAGVSCAMFPPAAQRSSPSGIERWAAR